MPAATDPFPVEEVAARLARLRERIAAGGGDPDRVVICAVTKGLGIEAVRAAATVGLVDVGENYAQELVAKQDQGGGGGAGGLRWHMIGRLQRNKVRLLAGRVHCWQSVDRIELGGEIARHDPGARVMLQVNTTGEPTKGGFDPDQVPSAVERFAAMGLDVRGLMAIGPTDPALDPRPGFERAAALATGLGLAELSMGMSGDLEAAVAAGSTMVRVGTALFGPRPPGVTSPDGFGG